MPRAESASARIKFEQEYTLDRHLNRMIALFDEVAMTSGTRKRVSVAEAVEQEASL